MNQYVIFYVPRRKTFLSDATEEEMAIIDLHAAYLQALLEKGQLILAGRCQDAPPGIAVFEAESDEAAAKIVENDPAVLEGVFDAELRPYLVAMMRGQTQ